MRKRQVQIPVLCEDDAHASFARAYLGKRGYVPGKFRIVPYPAGGRGSGKEHVRNGYAGEVREARRRGKMSQAGTYALLVMIDRDTDTQPDPYTDLDRRLKNAGLATRAGAERIAIFAPARSIETWAYHLLNPGREVDEATDYSRPQYREASDCGRAGGEFASYAPSDNCPLPSLVRGCQERSRIP
jgi:hypothetical protein